MIETRESLERTKAWRERAIGWSRGLNRERPEPPPNRTLTDPISAMLCAFRDCALELRRILRREIEP